MKKIQTLLVFILAISVVACKKSTDDEPIPNPTNNPPELSDNAYLFVFNALTGTEALDLNINGTEFTYQDLSNGQRTDYYNLKEGTHQLAFNDANTDALLLESSLALEGGQFYSVIIYNDKDSGVSLIVNNDYDELSREPLRASGSPRIEFSMTSVHVASNTDVVNLYNAYGQKISPNTRSDFSSSYLGESLSYGTSQFIETTYGGNKANAIFATVEDVQIASINYYNSLKAFLDANFNENEGDMIHLNGIPLVPISYADPGPGNVFRVDFYNSLDFEENHNYLIMLFDGDPEDTRVRATRITLNDIQIIR